jgi:hypothetical protein
MSNGSIVPLDAAGRRRSPATRRGYLAGRAPRSLLCQERGVRCVVPPGPSRRATLWRSHAPSR